MEEYQRVKAGGSQQSFCDGIPMKCSGSVCRLWYKCKGNREANHRPA